MASMGCRPIMCTVPPMPSNFVVPRAFDHRWLSCPNGTCSPPKTQHVPSRHTRARARVPARFLCLAPATCQSKPCMHASTHQSLLQLEIGGFGKGTLHHARLHADASMQMPPGRCLHADGWSSMLVACGAPAWAALLVLAHSMHACMRLPALMDAPTTPSIDALCVEVEEARLRSARTRTPFMFLHQHCIASDQKCVWLSHQRLALLCAALRASFSCGAA